MGKQSLYKNNGLKICKSSIHGFGVFTDNKIKSQEVIEECSVILIERNTYPFPKSLNDYLFLFLDNYNNETICLPIGFCPSMNSSRNFNAISEFDYDNNIVRIIAQRDIEVGEEITLLYSSFR
jgi:hypothetical protein